MNARAAFVFSNKNHSFDSKKLFRNYCYDYAPQHSVFFPLFEILNNNNNNNCRVLRSYKKMVFN